MHRVLRVERILCVRVICTTSVSTVSSSPTQHALVTSTLLVAACALVVQHTDCNNSDHCSTSRQSSYEPKEHEGYTSFAEASVLTITALDLRRYSAAYTWPLFPLQGKETSIFMVERVAHRQLHVKRRTTFIYIRKRIHIETNPYHCKTSRSINIAIAPSAHRQPTFEVKYCGFVARSCHLHHPVNTANSANSTLA